MRAVQFSAFGGPDVLALTEVPAPEPGPGALVRVHTAGVNPIDWKLRSGAMNAVAPLPLPHTPGVEFAGTVESAGPDAGFAPGAEVFGWSSTGAYAELALPGVIAAKPAALSWADAAALPVAGETAVRGLTLLGVGRGDLLLVHGASGAVGAVVAQLAIARGATVIGTGGRGNLDDIRALGATPVVYGDGLVQRVRELAPRGVDAVFDTAGKGALPDSIELRGGSTERIITIADPAAAELGVTFTAGGPDFQTPDLLAQLAAQVVAGTLKLTHAAGFPLARAAEAQELSQHGRPHGKITLTV
jgi:NADPH:quinone reductase-like Zn-dependent oxidoreductase